MEVVSRDIPRHTRVLSIVAAYSYIRTNGEFDSAGQTLLSEYLRGYPAATPRRRDARSMPQFQVASFNQPLPLSGRSRFYVVVPGMLQKLNFVACHPGDPAAAKVCLLNAGWFAGRKVDVATAEQSLRHVRLESYGRRARVEYRLFSEIVESLIGLGSRVRFLSVLDHRRRPFSQASSESAACS
jgi:hypothetical protein